MIMIMGLLHQSLLYRYVNYKVRKEIHHQDPVLKGSLVGDKIILAEYYGLSELLLSGKIQEFNNLRNE